MTRTHLVLAASAALFLAAFTVAQATDTALLVPATTAPYGAEIARETSCGSLRIRWTQELNVWKGGIRDGHDAMVQANEDAMKAILRRIEWLTVRGRCGG